MAIQYITDMLRHNRMTYFLYAFYNNKLMQILLYYSLDRGILYFFYFILLSLSALNADMFYMPKYYTLTW